MKKILFAAIACVVTILLQPKNGAAQEDMRLTEQDFYALVAEGHPVVKSARLNPDMAFEELRYARGHFDPKLLTFWDNKIFKGTNYFNYFDADIKQNLWIGELKAGYLRNIGEFVGTDVQTSLDGLIFVGYSLPIGEGLFIDKRRADLQKAQILQDMAVAQQAEEINKVMLSANKAYWEWYNFHQRYQMTIQAIKIADSVFQGNKILYERGDIAAIDTVKALVNLQKLQVEAAEAKVANDNARLYVSTFLWTQEGEPIDLKDNVVPTWTSIPENVTNPTSLNNLLAYAVTNHPKLVQLEGKASQLDVELRLRREMLKPIIELNTQYLWQGKYPFNRFDLQYWDNNHKLGISFTTPLFLRKERAKLNLTKIKMEQLDYKRSEANREIVNKVMQSHNQLQVIANNLEIQENVTDNYLRLFEAERTKMEFGESDQFLVNLRQQQWMENGMKLVKMRSELQKELGFLTWAAGTNAWTYQETP